MEIKLDTDKAGFDITFVELGRGVDNSPFAIVNIMETRDNVGIINHGHREIFTDDVLHLYITGEAELSNS